MQAQGHEAFVQCELAHVAPISWTSLNIDTYYWVSQEKQVQSISSATTWETEKCGWQRRLKLPPEVFAKTLNVTGSICRTELLPNSEGSTHQGGRWRTADAEIWEPEKSENVSSCVIASNCAIIGSRSFILQAFPTSSNQEHQAPPLPCAGKSLAQSPEHCQAVPSKCQYVDYLDAMDSTWFKDIPCDVSDPTHVNAVFHGWKRTCLLQLCLKLFIQQFWKVGTP